MERIFNIISERLEIKGIIQAGANIGQECEIFKRYTKNIVCFEPLPSIYNTLKMNHSDIESYNLALGDKKEKVKMFVASNNGESSSILKPLNHLKFYDITFNQEVDVEVVRFDEFMSNIKIKDFNILVSDTQGYELKVLKGFGDTLNNIDSIVIEYINSNLYENDSNLTDITDYVKKYNFNLIQTFDEYQGAGVALYLK
jgi:FkbM family methyltransferase